MKLLTLLAALLLTGCACTKDMAAGGATYAVISDPIVAAADVLITAATCPKAEKPAP